MKATVEHYKEGMEALRNRVREKMIAFREDTEDIELSVSVCQYEIKGGCDGVCINGVWRLVSSMSDKHLLDFAGWLPFLLKHFEEAVREREREAVEALSSL